MDQSLEQWRPVVGYEGLYEVSNYGKVRSVDGLRCNGRALHRFKGKLLKSQGQPYRCGTFDHVVPRSKGVASVMQIPH